ncbi:MAG: AMP-binding protein, partial [Trueperaceae bacterium]
QAVLLTEWNGTAREYADAPTVHERFSRQAARSPDAPAIEFDGATTSYGELDRRSNQLARHLRAMGLGPESRAALFAERSVEALVAVLGVLKAGGAYVPIDPAYPLERVAFTLADSGPVVVLTQSRLAGLLPATDAAVFRLDTDWGELAGQPDGTVDVAVEPQSLAYVIYTSGST